MKQSTAMATADSQPEPDGLELLAVSPEQNTAEAIETALRKAGRKVQVTWLGKPQELGQHLEEQSPAVICCETRDSQERLIALCLQLTRGVPVLPILPELEPGRTGELLQAGAADAISLAQPEHLAHVVLRELKVAKLHRDLAQAQQRLAQMEMRLDDILADSRDARASIAEGIHARLNPVYAALFGFDDPDELVGVPLMDLVAPEDRDAVKKKLSDTEKGKGTDDAIIFTAQKADDSLIPVQMRCQTVTHDGERQIEVMVAPDRQALATASDSQEGRFSLYHALADKQALLSGGQSLALLCICIDDVDTLQDNLGLEDADVLLNDVAAFLLDRIREGDRSFRFSAHEFVVMARRETIQDLKNEAEALRAAVDEEIFGDKGLSSPLTASIAVAGLDESADFHKRLRQGLKLARATSASRGNAVVEENSAEGSLSSQETDHKWLRRIEKALSEGGFTLIYQSIASLEGAPGQYYQVFLRMLGDQGEHIRAQDFLPTAERHDLMPQIDEWVISRALSVIAESQAENEEQVLFVTLSGASVERTDNFLPWLEKQISEQSVDCQRILFSLTEDILHGNLEKAVALSKGLRQMGFSIGISRFGTTPNSLKLLNKIPAEFIKLDASLTADLADAAENTQLGETVRAAQDKGIKIIAEHVEDANTMARLWQLGVNFVQGHFVQAPGADDRSD